MLWSWRRELTLTPTISTNALKESTMAFLFIILKILALGVLGILLITMRILQADLHGGPHPDRFSVILGNIILWTIIVLIGGVIYSLF